MHQIESYITVNITKCTLNISKLVVILWVSCFYLHSVVSSTRKNNCIVILHNAKYSNILHRVPLPLTHPEHLSSPLVFSWVFVSQAIVLCVVFSIVLFIHQFMASDYPFDIFKLYLFSSKLFLQKTADSGQNHCPLTNI
jgi:phosphoglycerol transferase MdoB-like AlkP superfamily enzyme